jgi:hypothetical protein
MGKKNYRSPKFDFQIMSWRAINVIDAIAGLNVFHCANISPHFLGQKTNFWLRL